jgi:hypothetical protein
MVKQLNTAAASALVLMSVVDIKKDQDGIKVALNKLDLRIHNNAVQCMMHAKEHGDTSLMRRLLIDVIDGKGGYRRQGLIQWMRLYSPMELKGDTINLGGMTDDGQKRPWKIDEAMAEPFWNNPALREIVKPVFQAGIVASISSGIRRFEGAIANTENGQPIDVTKPFYDGIKAESVKDILSQINTLVGQLPPDTTAEVRKAQAELRRLGVLEGTGPVNPEEEAEARVEAA